jgi:large subunit ribosomal protein L18
MAKGPRYRLSFRRRREGKTNYHRRIKLLRSKKYRLVVRCSIKHVTVQVVESLIKGDKILSQSFSKQLSKDFDWKYNLGNLPSAYLTGYLCGLRSKKEKIEEAILDLGIFVHDERVKAAFKGFLEAGIHVNHDKKWFGESLDERVTGLHIQNYAELLSKNDPSKYKKMFSKVLKNKADPLKIVDVFNKTKESMGKKV